MKYLTTLILTLAAATTLRAQTTATSQAPPAETFTLEQCILYAVGNSPETGIQAERNQIAKQNYLEAIGHLLPNLNASVGADFNFGRSLGDDNVYASVNSFNNSYRASSNLTIFDGLRSINSVRLERINRITGRHQLDQRRDEVAYATMEAFFNVVYYKQMVALAETQLEESDLNLRQTERMEELGIKGFPDVAEMRAQQAASAYNLTRQQNLLTVGIILLKEKMNFPIERSLDIVPGETDVEVTKTPLTPAVLYSRALDGLPAAQVAQSSARAAEMELKVARGARWPSLSIGGGYSTGFFRNMDGTPYDSFKNQFSNKRGYYVGASLNIPIFNGFSTTAGINRTKHNTVIARLERDASLRALYTEIEQTVADMNGTADQHAQAVRQRESSSVAHNVNQRKYDEGLVSALELHTSSNRLMQARADELQSRLVWILKKRMVDYYSGTPLVAPQTEN
jgi:outer membrane protein